MITLSQVHASARLDVEAIHERCNHILGELPKNLAPKNAATFFLEGVAKKEGTAQQQTGTCTACRVVVVSTGAYKFQSHLLACPLMPATVKQAFRNLRDGNDAKRTEKRERKMIAQEEVQLAAQDQARRNEMLKQQNIRVGIRECQVAAADKAIATFFYSNAIPFAAASKDRHSPYRQMIEAIQNAPVGYVPPNCSRLSNQLLDECHASMWKEIAARDPDCQLSTKFGACYVADGWDSCDNLPLINSAFITANDGGVYWRSVDTSGKVKDADYCASLMIQDIYDFGPLKVVAVVTDTCAVMQKCWSIVMDEFPWISCLPCQPHVISLLLKDLAKSPQMKQLINEEQIIVQWFSNHQFPLAKLREYTMQKLGRQKELVKAGATRFGTHTLVGERLQELKSSLQVTVVDPEYVAKQYKDSSNTEEDSGVGRIVRSNKGAIARKLILDDDPIGFWARVKEHVDTTLPIFKMLRRFDTGCPTIGKLYSGWFELGEFLESTDSSYKPIVTRAHQERWAYAHAPIVAAAYVLDPEFHEHSQEENREVMEGFLETVEKVAILVEARKRQSEYEKLWAQRAELISKDPSKQKEWLHFPKYPDIKDDRVKEFCTRVSSQLAIYRQKKGIFGHGWIFSAAESMPAYMWWDAHGASCPELQTLARLILAQPTSSSICERINSEFAFVNDVRRNRLGHRKANKLVGLFHNLRLLLRVKRCNYTEPVLGWNEEDEKTGLMKFGVANYCGSQSHKACLRAPVRPRIQFEDGGSNTEM